MKFTRSVHDPDLIVEEVEFPEGSALLIGRPDWVTLPDELGGGQADILEEVKRDWPGFGVCTHYRLDREVGGKTLWVAKADQFYWHTR